MLAGSLQQITDGKKEPADDQVVELPKGLQWVQIDLEKEYQIYAILLWHDHRRVHLFRDVVVQVADDSEFSKNVRTVFNNDLDNSTGLGLGSDKEYLETAEGRLIGTKAIRARYIHCHSSGCREAPDYFFLNRNAYQEIEVYASPTP